jgi:hypothetical protein
MDPGTNDPLHSLTQLHPAADGLPLSGGLLSSIRKNRMV